MLPSKSKLVERDWEKISESFGPRKNWRVCKYRWEVKLDPKVSKGPWGYGEDVKIIDLVNVYGKKWAFIKSQFPDRT